MQHITISGRIGKDAETRQAGNGDVTSFNVAVDQGYGQNKTSNWFRVNVWGKKGVGAAPYLLKGGVVTVVGELEISEYNGKPQYQINASNFTLPTNSQRQDSGRQGSNPEPDPRKSQSNGFRDDLDDDVPF